jgi:Variant SH3 domain
MPRARSPAPSQTQNMFGGSNSGAHVNGRNGERPREIHRTRSPGPSQDPSPSPTQTQNVFGSSNNVARVNGRNGGQPQEIPRARSPGPSQTQTQNMFGSLNSGARVNGRYGGQPQEIPRARSPAPSQTQSVSSNSNSGSRVNGRSGRHSQEIPRARSPAPRRSISPQPPREDSRSSQHSGGAYQSNGHNNSYRQSPSANTTQSSDRGYSPRTYSRHGSPSEFTRAVSPQPQFRQHNRPSSADGMELQLSANPVEAYGTDYDNHGSRSRDAGRPKSMYYGAVPETASRSRSKSLAVADPSRQYSRDGRPILHFGENPFINSHFCVFANSNNNKKARAKFNYAAVIPEELGFTKGDVLAIVRLQDDGWWEAEIAGIHSHGRTGLVPSNYLQDL